MSKPDPIITVGPEAKPRFHIMVKPTGPICNLRCKYCYYLSKEELLEESEDWKISEETLEIFFEQLVEAHGHNEIVVSWQGGEPTLLGLDFFKKVVELEKKYCPPDKTIENDFQTNGTLLDDEWCKFLKENNFLVGLSIDGPRELHDYCRIDRGGKPTFDRVFNAAKLLHEYKVNFNTLTVVNRENAKHPLKVYRFLRDEVKSTRMQFLPGVEPKDFTTVAPQYWDLTTFPRLGTPEARPGSKDSIVTDWSPDPEDFGEFMCTVFDEWLEHDYGRTWIYHFEDALGHAIGLPASMCITAQTCGRALALEHDGSLYSCDHYVYPKYCLGNIHERTLEQMIFSPRQQMFGEKKKIKLPQYCRNCRYHTSCNGGCPRNRFICTPDGDPGLNYLCSGLKKYFKHISPHMQRMAEELGPAVIESLERDEKTK